MNIRKYNHETDFNSIGKLFYDVFTSEPWNDGWESVEQVKEYLLDTIKSPRFIGFVAIKDDSIIGFAVGNITIWYTGQNYDLSEICISNKLQRNGVGSALIQYIREYLKDIGVKNITLLTSKDIFSYSFYKKNNFDVVEDIRFLVKSLG